jgi:hypothetical protein
MSFTLLLAVTAAVAASMGYLAARKHGDEEDAPPDSGDPSAAKQKKDRDKDQKDDREGAPPNRPAPKPARKPAGAAPSPFASLPLALGDVVSSGAEERWLAGAVVAREGGRVVGALFLAPEGAVHKAVAVFAPPRKDIWWMSPASLASPNEPPATIEIDGVALARKGRLPVTLERLGQGAPHVGEEGLWAVYDRGRDVALVVASGGQAHAWSGIRLEEEEYDRLGGGGD